MGHEIVHIILSYMSKLYPQDDWQQQTFLHRQTLTNFCTEMSDNSLYFHTAFICSANLTDQINIRLNRLLSHNINKREHAK